MLTSLFDHCFGCVKPLSAGSIIYVLYVFCGGGVGVGWGGVGGGGGGGGGGGIVDF